MTNRARRRLVVAAAAGLAVLLAASASHAQWTIAPFSINIKSKIYTFNPNTTGGGEFSCAACYVPGAVYSSYGTTGGAAYFYGPFFVNPRATATIPTASPPGVGGITPGEVTTGYYFNPYWGAQHSTVGGAVPSYKTNAVITNSQGGNPYTPLCVVDLAHLYIASTQTAGGPDFYVSPSQPGLAGVGGSGSFGSGGNYLGTVSAFNGTNNHFTLGSGSGPGNATFNAPAPQLSKGQVRFTQGTDHANGFGGTLDFLGQNGGFYLLKTPGGGGTNCASGAVLCYYYIPFLFPVNAATSVTNAGPQQNQWTSVTPASKVNVFPTNTTTPSPAYTQTTAFAFNATTVYTTHKATTGNVVMAQPFPSVYTYHSVHGSDNRTHLGAGNITLVTGWLGHSILTTTSNWGGTSVYKFTFHTVPQTPSLASPALGALGGLMAIAAVYVIRKRSSSN